MNISSAGTAVLAVFAFLAGNISMLAAVWVAVAVLKKVDRDAD